MSDGGPVCWWITRELADAGPLLAELRARGLDARPLPCIARELLPWPDLLVPASSGRTLVVCTSAPAAHCALAQAASAGWHDDVAFAAVAPTTAEVFSRAGVGVAIVVRGGSAALADAIALDGTRGAVARILYPTSDVGLGTPEQDRACTRLASVCDDVRRAAVYRTRPAPGLAAAVVDVAAHAPPAGLVFFSPSAVDAFLEHAPAHLVRSAQVVCHGASTLRAWTTRAGTPARLLADAGLDDVVATLASWSPGSLAQRSRLSPEVSS